jgi:hypothetical protein
VSGVRERLFDSFKLEDNFPENHLLHRIDRFLDLIDPRQYLPDFRNRTCRPLLESELMIRARFAGCYLANRSDRRATSQKVAGRDGSIADTGVEGEALATNQPFRQITLVASGRATSPAVATIMVEASGPRSESRPATRAPLDPGLNGSCLSGTLRRNSAGHRRIFTILNIYISSYYDRLRINIFNFES